MNMKITPRKPEERGGIACLPLVKNVPEPKSNDWKMVTCPICGEPCWESNIARQVLKMKAMAACTMCALKIGMNK